MKMKKRILFTALVSLGILTSPGVINHIHADMISIQPAPSKPTSVSQPGNKKRIKRGRNHSYQSIKDRINRTVHDNNNRQQISGMKQFAKRRVHFYYPKVGFNTRDLGGYVTANGRYQVKPDRIIRSAGLDNLSNQGVRTLKKLKVHQDVDLRFPDQIKKRPDPGEPKSRFLNRTKIDIQDDPVYSAQEDAAMRSQIDNDGEWYFYGRSAVDNHDAIKAYQRVFRDLLANHHGAVLYHCDVGRDRTGVVSALILSALGVKRNTIYHDYLLTNYYRHKNGMHAAPYNRQAGELKHFLDTIDRQDGNVNHYLHKVIGLKHSDVKKLRSMYLEPVDD